MKKYLLGILFALCVSTLWGQNNGCPGFHNPTNFNSVAGGAGSWSARVGDRIQGSGGSTGSNVLSTCAYPTSPVIKGNLNITSPTLNSGYCPNRCACNHCSIFDGHDQRFRIYTSADAGMDLFTVNAQGQGMQRIPEGHNTSIRLGDMRATGQCVSSYGLTGNNKGAEALYYTMQVNSQNALLFIDYAIVACRYNHTPREAGEFLIRVCGKNNATGQWNNVPLNDSLWFNVPAPEFSSALPSPWVEGMTGTPSSAGATMCAYCYKPWTRVAISLIDYLYDSVRVEMYTSDCIYNVDPIYAYIAGSCQPMAITASGCPGGASDAVDTLRAPEGLMSYTWYVSSTGYSGNTSNTEAMDAMSFRQVQATSTNNIYVARTSDFVVTEGPNRGDTVGTQTYKCVMTSAMDPSKPFHSRIYATVSNTKPIVNAKFDNSCDSVVSFEAMGKISYQGTDAPHIVDSITSWVIYQGSADDTPAIDTVYGKFASYKFSDDDVHAIKLTLYTEDSSCYSAHTYQVHPMLPPDNHISISKRTLCVGDMATITDLTENIVGRRWEFADDTIDSQAPGNSMSSTREILRTFNNFENPFRLITINDAGCSDTLYDTIYLFSDPEVYFSNDTVICNGHETHVVASTPVNGCTFAWFRHKNQAGESPICEGNTLLTRPTAPHTKYYLRITAPAGCEAWDSITVSLLSTKITAAPSHAKHCPGDSVTLTGHGALWYEWSSYPGDPDLEAQAHNQSITVSPHQDTRYYLTGYAADSCDIAAINILVQEVPLPVLNFSYSPHYIDTETPVVSFNDLSENRSSSQWTFGDGATTTGQNITHHFDIYVEGCNEVTLSSLNDLGCSVDTTFTISIDTFGFYRPNVFTPNKNNNNTFSVICPSSLERFHIAIFNRRGQLVYSSDDQHFVWDGTSNGQPLPQDAYPYVITYTRAGAISEYRVKGTITLLR